jgi:hypothetical protein
MALDFFTGFDHYATSDLTAGRFTSSTNATIQASIYRHGGSALSLVTGGTANVIKTGLSNAATRVLGFGFYSGTITSCTSRVIAALSDGTPTTAGNVQVGLAITSSGNIALYRGRALSLATGGTQLGSNSVNVLSSGIWYYIELVVTVHGSTGIAQVFVNGSNTNWQNLSSQNTQSTANAYANAFGFNGDSTPANLYFDDLYILSGSGGVRTARLGDVKAISKIASAGDGSLAQFTPSTGTDNGEMVNESVPNGDTDYNSTANVGDIDTYNFPAIGVSGTIFGLQVLNWSKKTDAGTCDSRDVLRITSTNYFGSVVNQGTSYAYAGGGTLKEQSPATSANWTVGEIDGAEYGIERNA